MAVYIIQSGEGGPVKIGFAKRPNIRLKELQTGSSSQLRMLRLFEGGRLEEAILHKEFSGQRLCGEWFAPSQEMLSRDFGLKPIDPNTPEDDNYSKKILTIPEGMLDAIRQYRHDIKAKSETEAYLRLIESGLDVYDPDWRQW